MSKIWCARTFESIFKRLKSRLKIWFELSLIASAIVIIVCFVYGLDAAVLPLLFLLFFFLILFVFAFNASIQAGSNPRLWELGEPDFWLSPVYNAWLYVTNKESWAVYASLFSCLLAVFAGSVFGGFILFVQNNVASSVFWASWLAGLFLTFSIALVVSTTVAFELEI